jgi:tetratricopeptide (TPR) repeat protein
MRNYLRAIVMFGLVIGAGSGLAIGQVDLRNTPQASTGASLDDSVFADRAELLRRIALYETALQQAKEVHSPIETLVKLNLHLGAMYGDLAMYPRAEQAMQRAIALLRGGPESELAEAISNLALLHVVMGEMHGAEKEGLEALRIRERVAEPVAIALSWSQMAALYLRRHEYKKAVEFGQKAFGVLGGDTGIDPSEWIGVRFTVARALCESGDSAKAIPMIQQSIETAKVAYGKDSLPEGIGGYLLGYAYWHTGDMTGAAEWMERGTTRMKVELGWGHPMYVEALGKYALFLRGRGQLEAAAVVEREVRQAEAVVDVRSLPQHTGAMGLTGQR